jgi:hypothetical protein
MPAVFAPGVVLLSAGGTIGSQPWATVMHWSEATPPASYTQGQLDQLVSSFISSYTTNLKPTTPNNVVLVGCQVVDIGTATGLTSHYTGAVITGGATSALEPASLCVNVQYKIASRYRGGHPRGMWPLMFQIQMSDESHWSAPQLATFTTNFKAFITSILTGLGGGGWTSPLHVVPRWTYTITDDPAHHKYKRVKSGYIRSDPVVNYIPQPTVGSQRGRLTV